MRIVFLLFIATLLGCHKNPIVIQPSCIDFEYSIDECIFGAGPLYGHGDLQFQAPFFNPNNADEFVFIEINYAADIPYKRLYIYNFSSGEKRYLTDNPNYETQPKWNQNNKIVFNITTSLFLIKSDGTGLEQLTFDYISTDPEWVDSSTISYTINSLYVGRFLNIHTDSFKNIESSPLTQSAVSSDLVIAATNGGTDDPNIAISAIDSFNWNVITDNEFISGKDRINCIQWHPNNVDIYYTKWNNGLYKINSITKEEECILEGCQSRWYNFFSISPDGKKILVERVDATFQTGVICYIYETSSIVLMDIDGSNEITILPKPE